MRSTCEDVSGAPEIRTLTGEFWRLAGTTYAVPRVSSIEEGYRTKFCTAQRRWTKSRASSEQHSSDDASTDGYRTLSGPGRIRTRDARFRRPALYVR